jgi:uncharacterized membrane protein YedE/YeeE
MPTVFRLFLEIDFFDFILFWNVTTDLIAQIFLFLISLVFHRWQNGRASRNAGWREIVLSVYKHRVLVGNIFGALECSF